MDYIIKPSPEYMAVDKKPEYDSEFGYPVKVRGVRFLKAFNVYRVLIATSCGTHTIGYSSSIDGASAWFEAWVKAFMLPILYQPRPPRDLIGKLGDRQRGQYIGVQEGIILGIIKQAEIAPKKLRSIINKDYPQLVRNFKRTLDNLIRKKHVKLDSKYLTAL